MLRNRIYYGLKPFIPQSVRTAIRRTMALRLRKHIGDVWPVMPGSERPPENWPGWPKGRKFAVVLTHDVESKAGVRNCRSLMEMELDLGFRSSFNFVPEGSYRVPAQLREELNAKGFEVGIHDLKHDGRLFTSRRNFKRHATRINDYAREWGASGFRSAFMLRNLDWLHDLDVQYDASTFDTDPFEPQPDGRHTTFRSGAASKWQWSAVPASSEGYVELPYTLPQDSTRLWCCAKRLLRSGCANLIGSHSREGWFSSMHIRITCPSAGRRRPQKYPAELYREFLT